MYHIVPMTKEYAMQYLTWEYPEPYSFYNLAAEYIEQEWAEISAQIDRWFAVLNDQGEMAGFFEYGQPDAGGMEIGLGLRPEDTGKGRGAAFVTQCITFGRRHFAYQGPIVLRVAPFNQRAIRTYQKVGFTITGTEEAMSHKSPITFLCMRLAGETDQ